MKKAFLIFFCLSLLLPPAAGAASGGISLSPDKVGKAKMRAGLAVAPKGAPPAVVRAIEAANKIAKKPYRWAGGHALWSGGINNYIKSQGGFDCSGSVSFALGAFGGRWVKRPKSSGLFMNWGKRGRGRWFTVYAGPSHAYLTIAGLRFDTSGLDERGTRWSKSLRGMPGLEPRRLARK